LLDDGLEGAGGSEKIFWPLLEDAGVSGRKLVWFGLVWFAHGCEGCRGDAETWSRGWRGNMVNCGKMTGAEQYRDQGCVKDAQDAAVIYFKCMSRIQEMFHVERAACFVSSAGICLA